ncbi:MAG: CBS domain-containing protein [Nitrospiraceae bacterium]|nr:MAG: CBS domain-containing protein [Nitrospiraceae bacterium]
MSNGKTVKDVMIDVFEFPHIPYWFSIKQAIGITKKALLTSDKCLHPLIMLVFDEKYNLVGTLTLKDIIGGLEPKYLKATTKAQVPKEDESGLALLWDTLFDSEAKQAAERPVSEAMAPTKIFLKPDDPLTKAAYLMIHNDLILLPVLEDKKKFVGLVRMIEIFNEVSDAIFKG